MDDQSILTMFLDESLLDEDVDMVADIQPPSVPQEEAPPNQDLEAHSDLLLVEDLGPDHTMEFEDGSIVLNQEDIGDTVPSPPPTSSPPNSLPPLSSLPPPHPPSPLPAMLDENPPTSTIPVCPPVPKPRRKRVEQKTVTRTMAAHPGTNFGSVDVRLQKLSLNPQQFP